MFWLDLFILMLVVVINLLELFFWFMLGIIWFWVLFEISVELFLLYKYVLFISGVLLFLVCLYWVCLFYKLVCWLISKLFFGFFIWVVEVIIIGDKVG